MRIAVMAFLSMLALSSPAPAAQGNVLFRKVVPAGEPVIVLPHPACPLGVSVMDDDGDGLVDRVVVEPDKACDDAFKDEMKKRPGVPRPDGA